MKLDIPKTLKTLWTVCSSFCFGFGVLGLIPMDFDGTLMMPLWASIPLTVFGGIAYYFAPSFPIEDSTKE